MLDMKKLSAGGRDMAAKFLAKATGKNGAPPPAKTPRPAPVEMPFEPADLVTLDPDPFLQCVQLERFGVILAGRQKWGVRPDFDAVLKKTCDVIDERYALVPEGFVTLAKSLVDVPGAVEEDLETAPFLLAKHTVTNVQFQKFVDAGGYANLELWPQDIWPHLIDFKDLTDHQAPRYWKNGRHNKLLANHPVVGVNAYEADAYCKWAGYRLPTEAQWQMAATWRIRSAANTLRRYPWGDALDIHKCNIWASCIGRTTPVDAYKNGAAPNDVVQLIGNVWEWTASDFELLDETNQPVVGDMLMRTIRGGAFDTYFAAQSTSMFRTGLPCIARPHNVGFRCALELSDVPQCR